MIRILPVLFPCLLATLPLHAGDAGGKSLLSEKSVITESCEDLGGSITMGYMSDYLLHGLRVNRDTAIIDVNYQFESLLPLTFGATHQNGISSMFPYFAVGPLDVTDVYLAAKANDIAGFDFTVKYTQRFLSFDKLDSADGSYGEIGIDLRRNLGFADFVIESAAGLNSRSSFFAAGGGNGWVHRAGLEKTIAFCDSASLILSTGVGYHDGYFFDSPGTSNWSHYYAGASLPIQLNCRTTLTPYIGFNGVQQWNVFAPQGDTLHGGLNLSVRF